MVTGLYAGIFSEHVCVVENATDEEILNAVNAHHLAKGTGFTFSIVLRTLDDCTKADVARLESYLPGKCVECDGRLHMVVR